MVEHSPRPRASNTRRGGIRLFRIFDIEIRLDLSVVIIFGLIVYSLASGVFPAWHPDWPVSTVWVTAFAAGVLFFVSLLAHELSHSLVARRYGIRVPRITLFLFGGMAEIESEARTPSAEFAIAIAGPLMSMAIALACSALAASAFGDDGIDMLVRSPEEGMQQASPVITAAVWLGSVNFMLAIFNMVPGFPLDGGRVFRALLWRLTGDQLLATRYAATAGRLFGWAIMMLGLWNLFALQSLGGMWMILIGWFISHLAAMSYSQALTQRVLAPLSVADLMRTRFDVVTPDLRVADFVEDCLLRSSQLLWPVVVEGRCVGILSLAEVMALPAERRADAKVQEIMVPIADADVLMPDMDATRATSLLTAAGERPLAVLRDGQVVGLLRSADLLRWMMLHDETADSG
ncbi:MAG: site-2 protease family protein [Pseudomonadales bacterium]|nr:site-2 protease family protein [Pseudomonadales bacterium]